MSQPVQQSQLPTCQVCKLDPLPESTQYLPFMAVQFLLLLYSIKLCLTTLLIGFIFSKTIWVCPLCKRNVGVEEGKAFPTQDHIILRMNDCMVLVSKTKFRVVASAVAILLIYLFAVQPSYHYEPRARIEKTWKSIISNCGYDTYIQNSFKFKYLYSFYEESNGWDLEGIFLSRDKPGKHGYVTAKIKMNPTQFKDPNVEDLLLVMINPTFPLETGDIIKFRGSWSGRRDHLLIFVATEVTKSGGKVNNISDVDVITHGLLREHSS